MKFNIVQARAKRNKFNELAGKFYRDNTSQIVEELNKANKRAYFGIQDESGKYTVIGEKFVYFSTALGIEGEVSNADFLEVLQKNAMNLGKGGEFEFVNINKKESVWVLDSKTMCAMWNIIMLLCEAKKNT
jgi:hypothetical protein